MRPINEEHVVRDIAVVGASAGGIQAVTDLLSLLPEELSAAIGLVIHRAASSRNWAEMVGKYSSLPVLEPSPGDRVLPGHVYLAPADCHMTFHDGIVVLDRNAARFHSRPALNPLFNSVAMAYRSRVLGIVMTGGGSDGAEGLRNIWKNGGICLVQSPQEAQHASMPSHALAADHVSAALEIEQLANSIILLSKGSALSIADRAADR
jgi:two-component system chemotaxis response regulator CheB